VPSTALGSYPSRSKGTNSRSSDLGDLPPDLDGPEHGRLGLALLHRGTPNSADATTRAVTGMATTRPFVRSDRFAQARPPGSGRRRACSSSVTARP